MCPESTVSRHCNARIHGRALPHTRIAYQCFQANMVYAYMKKSRLSAHMQTSAEGIPVLLKHIRPILSSFQFLPAQTYVTFWP